MKTVKFVAITGESGFREGEDGWQVFVDDNLVLDDVRSDCMDIADCGFNKLWKTLGIKLEFDYD